MMPAKSKGRAKTAKNHHKLCQPLPKGDVLKDLLGKSWKIGEPIGSGGFGLIYSADENSKIEGDDARYVIKVEPHENGPLYSEIAFYQRVAKSGPMDEWRKQRKLSFLPIPAYIAHGLHTHDKEKLRFLVMPRFGLDLHKLWLQANKKFKRETVCKIAIIMLDGLEYLHSKEYVHADIKGSNILCDMFDKKQIYLVDYGLASRYSIDGEHKPHKPDPRKAHDGTIEYTSTDAHDGSNPSRRGDLEILGFFLLHLIAGRLPWEDKLSDCQYVSEQKKRHLKKPERLVENVYGSSVPEISQLLRTAVDLKYDERPDYDMIRDCFKRALKSMKASLNSSLDFTSADKNVSFRSPSPVKQKKAKVQKRKVVTPHPVKSKCRKQPGPPLYSDDFNSSSEESSVSSEHRGNGRETAEYSISDENSPVCSKPRIGGRRRKFQKIPSYTSEGSPDKSFEDFSSVPKKNSLKSKRKPAASRKTPLPASTDADNLTPVHPREILPKTSRPPEISQAQTRYPTRQKPAVQAQEPKLDQSSDDSIDPCFEVSGSSPKLPNTRASLNFQRLEENSTTKASLAQSKILLSPGDTKAVFKYCAEDVSVKVEHEAPLKSCEFIDESPPNNSPYSKCGYPSIVHRTDDKEKEDQYQTSELTSQIQKLQVSDSSFLSDEDFSGLKKKLHHDEENDHVASVLFFRSMAEEALKLPVPDRLKLQSDIFDLVRNRMSAYHSSQIS